MELPKVLSTFLPLTSRPSVWLSASHSEPRIRKYLKRIKHLNSTQNISYFCGYLLKILVIHQFSCVQLFATPWTRAHQDPCPSSTPGVYSNSCPLSRWCHPTISSSVVPFSSCLQSFPAKVSFPMSQFFISGGQSIEVSVSASVLPMNIQDWFPLRLTCWISLQSKGLSRVFSNTTVQKYQFIGAHQHSTFFIVQLTHLYMTTLKTTALTRWTFFGKMMSLLFNMLSRLVIAFLPRSKYLLISRLQSPSAVIWSPRKWSLSLFPLFPHLFAMKWWGQMPWS